MNPDLDFGQALQALRGGERVTRRGWNGRGMWLALIRDSRAQLLEAGIFRAVAMAPFIMMRTATAEFVPWLASQTDLVAVDWLVVEG
jgi:hypothetical protein